MLARNLLSDDGVIFISIDDNEANNCIKICNEVFGEHNFVANLIWKSKSGGANDSKFFAVDHEYITVYAKNSMLFNLNLDKEAESTTSYNRKDEKGEYSLERLDKQSIRYSAALDYEIIGPDGKSYFPKHKDPNHPNATWRWSKQNTKENYDKLVFEKGNVYTKNYKKGGAIARSLLIDGRFGRTRTGKTDCYALFNRDYFSNPKPYKLVRYLEMIASDSDSIILDFFSGSATTAHADRLILSQRQTRFLLLMNRSLLRVSRQRKI
jgi:adenine-specific DNA-methyltransferase